jgi:uncharacterized protein (UPF0218 family)
MSEVRRIMQLAFEEYRGRLVPPSGALMETLEEVRTVINRGGAFLAFVGDVTVGSARTVSFQIMRMRSGLPCSQSIEGDASRSPS